MKDRGPKSVSFWLYVEAADSISVEGRKACVLHIASPQSSGKAVQITASAETPLEDLRLRAQRSLQAGRGILLNAAGELLNLKQTVGEAGLKAGDCLTLHVRQTTVASTREAFAALLGDGSVVTWGGFGGDSSSVQEQLKDVRQIHATQRAFAAFLDNGSVVTWGDGSAGNSSKVQDRLKRVKHIPANHQSFAAILEDGSVVTWGGLDSGGDSMEVQEQLKNVQHIQATEAAFADILSDGSVVTWGEPEEGGDSSAVQEQLKNMQHIQATSYAFAAILGNGSVVT